MLNLNEETKMLISHAEKGFQTLKLPDKYVKAALKSLEAWLTDDMFKDYVSQLKYLIETEKWEFLLDSFYQVIPFGTGGRRGLVGIGTNRINKWTIQASAQGHSQYLIAQHGESAKKKGIVLTYDVRKFSQKSVYNLDLPNPVMNLDCKDLAIAAAEVYTANGIKVYMFNDVRSTPELSFAIRHLKAVAGDMFSASHNPPTDNGKKVYDEHGGQLIPPNDQILVDEVTNNVKEIKTIPFKDAVEKKLVEYISKEVDDEYIKAVSSISLSDERGLNVLYSPLHGTGKTSYYPVLKNLGYNVVYDEKTSNLSGAFEGVMFNIPNPEVVQSFNTLIEQSKNGDYDLLINSDPDADRIGIMVKHKGEWRYLIGNEIGTILTEYGISKWKAAKKINKNTTIVKTAVTTSMIEKIAKENNVNCIGDLLVGFKYIAEIMNKLEDDGKSKDFILGTEESHGFIMGNYVRDKDGAAAALWICELAAELKKQGKTIIDYIDEIYSRYGYCNNYLNEVRLLGAMGMEQITKIMDHFREKDIEKIGKFQIKSKIDKWKGSPFLSETDKSSRNVMIFKFADLETTEGIKITVRPSGTEPKVKIYFEIQVKKTDSLEKDKAESNRIKDDLEKAFMTYCYKIIGVDFPERGFLVFWQLPLNDKLKYFDVEKKIADLKKVQIDHRKEELMNLLKFLGANPIEKVDKAFKEKYKKGILEYLEIE
jgi:phosphoglucomutase/phosphomannomutase